MDRGQADGVGDLYSRMEKQGELWTYPGRVCPVSEFLKDSAARFSSKVARSAADRYRKAEALDALDSHGLRWPFELRGMGASSIADGSCRRSCFSESGAYWFDSNIRDLLLLESAISEAAVRKDKSWQSGAFKVAEQWAYRCSFARRSWRLVCTSDSEHPGHGEKSGAR